MALNRFYHPDKFESRATFLSKGIKCVFISYQKDDLAPATKVADYLLNAGVDVYFDRYDSELRIHHQSNNPQQVTNSILKGINNSSHMITIASQNTIRSSWVPFEIGYGYHRTDLSVLCLKGIPKGSLPEYVRSVRVIRDIYDFNNLIPHFTGKSKEYLVENKFMSEHSTSVNPLYQVMDGLISDQY